MIILSGYTSCRFILVYNLTRFLVETELLAILHVFGFPNYFPLSVNLELDTSSGYETMLQ